MTRGFTLIELLVTIAIISLLSSVIITSLGDARERAQDVKRLSDIKAIQNALELYREEHGTYPPTDISVAPLGIAFDCEGDTSLEDSLQPLVDEGYLSAIPHDPDRMSSAVGDIPPYCYWYQSPAPAVNCPQSDAEAPYDYAMFFSVKGPMLGLPKWDQDGYNSHCVVPR